MNVEGISSVVVNTAFHIHQDLRSGLLESVYEAVAARMFEAGAFMVERQVAVAFDFNGMQRSEDLKEGLL